MKLNATQILEQIIATGASDLHLCVGAPPYIRVKTVLKPMENMPVLTIDDLEYFLSQIVDTQQREILEINKELDFSVALGNKARFRVNAFFQKGYPALAMRYIPMHVPTLAELNLPPYIANLCNIKQGLILVVGPTGHGKSTTLAAMIDQINGSRSEHIVTIEDPIEYVFTNKLSLINQREMYLDSHSWDVSLKSALRQDPNVVLIGEMRDAETIAAVLQIAESGHLVFATLHTNSAAQSVERIIASFPNEKQNEVRSQLAQVIEVVISQRLIPSPSKGVLPALEILLATDAVKNLVREGKGFMLDNIISTSSQLGMVSLERSLAMMVNRGEVEFLEAIKYAPRGAEFKRLVDSKFQKE